MLKTKIYFIVNPISGGRNKSKFEQQIFQFLDLNKFDYQIYYTERVNHATEISENLIAKGAEYIAAVGGDGTVNEIAKTIINTDVKLIIIPFGSGNGLARHMNIPMDIPKAIKLINNHQVVKNDFGTINEHPFFCTSGIGFDALIGQIFSTLKGRGFSGYIKAVLGTFLNYKAQHYTIELNNKVINKEAFMITFANASQYGNNAYIAPLAKIDDGLLDVCIFEPFKFIDTPMLAWRLFTKSAHKSKYMTVLKSQSVIVKRNDAGPIHLDGEPLNAGQELNVFIYPSKLNVVVGLN